MWIGRTVSMLCAIVALGAVMEPLFAQHDHGGSMPVGYHEFRMFGGDGKFYLSHFPMFSSIHAFQYIIEVALEDSAEKAMASDVNDDVRAERRYQLSPYKKGAISSNRAEDEDDWVLPDMLNIGKSFTGDIFYLIKDQRKIVSQNARVTVKHVVWKSELNPRFPRPNELTYILFGTPKRAFLAHEISAPPKPGKQESDFDQIVSVEVSNYPKELSPSSSGKQFVLIGKENSEKNKLSPGQRVTLSNQKEAQETIGVVVLQELQMEQLTTQR